ncbi:HIT-like domain-containing protein [Phakopsora pachyrhizi]|uniref:Bis(5'-adenosyl)-triphosphatase n=1 Tax=Phakopsora pachyrhizi TaxID=170000 RepID=A0AAV0BNU7_PHAPC|nr:HIT-like domain-containing protein [Phakopsora pachyrhizi]
MFKPSSSSNSDPIKFFTYDVTDQVFYQSTHSFAIVNLRPIVTGHVLVIPRRNDVLRLKDLRSEELIDLFSSIQKVSNVIERVHQADSLNVSIQDGPFAGQSVPHLHAHIIPRKPRDFIPNDRVYESLEYFEFARSHHLTDLSNSSARQFNNDQLVRQDRSDREMIQEALSLSNHFR